MNFSSITAKKQRALLLGTVTGLLLGLGLMGGLGLAADAAHPSHETEPASKTEKGATPSQPWMANAVPGDPSASL